jgi:ABC-type multidrug transport system ATPase subunit
MWTLISSTMKGRSVILTTHSMEECEALCQRIGNKQTLSLVITNNSYHHHVMSYHVIMTNDSCPNNNNK